MDFITSHTVTYTGLMKNPPDLVELFLSNVFWGLALAIIFVKWAKVYTFKKGMIVSVLVCVPLSFAIDLQMMSLMNIFKDYSIVIVDALGTGVLAALTGGIMGWIYGKMGVLPE